MKILVCFAFLSIAARGTTVFIGSDDISTTNDSGHPTVEISPKPSWADALPGSEWISYGQTSNHDDPDWDPLVTFSTEFLLSGVITGGNLRVLAGDTATVVLNGHELIPARPIGNKESKEGIFTFAGLEPYLIDGENTLLFVVLQERGRGFGLDFAGTFEDPAPTPEPGTLGVIGGGLLILAVLRRRK
jgi:hypothetical protein